MREALTNWVQLFLLDFLYGLTHLGKQMRGCNDDNGNSAKLGPIGFC